MKSEWAFSSMEPEGFGHLRAGSCNCSGDNATNGLRKNSEMI